MALSISVPSPLDWVPLQIPTESSTFWKVRVWFSKGLHSDKAWLGFFIPMVCPDTVSLTTMVQPSKMEDWPSGTILLLIYSFFPDSFVPRAHLSLLLGIWHWRQTCFHCWRSRCVVGNWCTKKESVSHQQGNPRIRVDDRHSLDKAHPTLFLHVLPNRSSFITGQGMKLQL